MVNKVKREKLLKRSLIVANIVTALVIVGVLLHGSEASSKKVEDIDIVVGYSSNAEKIDVLEPEVTTEVIEEPVVTTETEVEKTSQYIKEYDLTDEECYMLAKIAMAEAEGEDIEGKALVINVVLNRVQHNYFPDSVEEVIFEEGQFTPICDGRWYMVEPNEDCWVALNMVLEGWDESSGALYFESIGEGSWHWNHLNYLFRHGNHYFYTML